MKFQAVRFRKCFLRSIWACIFIPTFAFQYYNNSVAKPTGSGTISGTQGQHSVYDNVHKYIERLDNVSSYLLLNFNTFSVRFLAVSYGSEQYRVAHLGKKY